jgi:hypothetical protein
MELVELKERFPLAQMSEGFYQMDAGVYKGADKDLIGVALHTQGNQIALAMIGAVDYNKIRVEDEATGEQFDRIFRYRLFEEFYLNPDKAPTLSTSQNRNMRIGPVLRFEDHESMYNDYLRGDSFTTEPRRVRTGDVVIAGLSRVRNGYHQYYIHSFGHIPSAIISEDIHGQRRRERPLYEAGILDFNELISQSVIRSYMEDM